MLPHMLPQKLESKYDVYAAATTTPRAGTSGPDIHRSEEEVIVIIIVILDSGWTIIRSVLTTTT